MDIKKCDLCNKSLIPDKKSVRDGTNEWDKHIYKFNCDCLKNKDTRVSIG